MKNPYEMTYDELHNTIRGMNLVGAVTKDFLDAFFEKLDKIEWALDESDQEDTWGSEGWRRGILREDR